MKETENGLDNLKEKTGKKNRRNTKLREISLKNMKANEKETQK